MTASLCALIAAGCASYHPWIVLTFPPLSGPIPGALNIGDARPPIQTRCEIAYNTYSKCDYAFIDSDGKRIDIFGELMVALDAHAERTAELKPWVNKIDMENPPDPSRVPYKMFLLSISPAIVLATPIRPSRSEYYKTHCSTLLFKGCIQSQGFRGSAYWFHESPPIVDGSFWFTSDEPQGAVHYLKKGEAAHEITVGQAMLRLVQADTRWSVQRVK